jgi:signal transduction histidine kinase
VSAVSGELPSRPKSAREVDARVRMQSRRRRTRNLLRPIGLAAMAIVAAETIDARPHPGLHGSALGVSVAALVFLVGIGVFMTESFIGRGFPSQLALTTLVGAAGVALAALQPHAANELSASAAVWMAVIRLPLRVGALVGGTITAGLTIVTAIDSSGGNVLASVLLCALLGLAAYSMRTSRDSQDRTELLLAELQDARDAQALAAAAQERGRIAGELHDVLAHSLSGAAIQLQGARMLAEQAHAEPRLREAIERSSQLVRDGLDDARRAVGALRGDQLPTVEELDGLIESFRADLDVDATLRIEGDARALPADASLALYRGVQEALTNVARYAPGAVTSVVLHYAPDRTTLCVEDRSARNGGPAVAAKSPAAGGGHGLAGMRERVERAGGRMQAGPTDDGWQVTLEVPV